MLLRFAAWRAGRPFWGAAVALAGAIELYCVTRAPLSVVVMQGLPGLATLFIAALTIVLAILTLAQPHLRQVTGWVIVVLAVLSILVSNLGGFVVGMLLMVTGGAMLTAWDPADDRAPVPAGDVPVRARVVVPLLAVALVAPAGGVSRGGSIWDLLFPPAPAPSATTPASPAAPAAPATPAPTAAPGTAPAPVPAPSAAAPSATAGPAITPSAPAAPPDCSRSAYPRAMPAPGSRGALETAATLRDCTAAAADDPVRTAAAGDPPPVGAEVSRLTASSLTMNGLSYDGVTTLDSPSGPVRVLLFSLDTLDIAGMRQSYPFAGGTVTLANRAGDAHVTGDVKLYVTRLTGSVFGLVELTFTPDLPPPLIVPFLVLTGATADVALVQAGQVRASSLSGSVR